MIMGSENTSSIRYFKGRDNKPDHSETIDGQLEDRGYGYDGIFDEYTIRHGLIGAPVQYGLLENARRARLGLSVQDYRQAMGELFAPMSKVAAKNPYSSAPVERTVDELVTVTDKNRMICDPYPRLMVARDQVNMGAAALLMSVESARKLGVPEAKWVYLRGHADMKEQKLLGRPDIGASPASVTAVREALRVAGIGIDDVSAFDLYSCFPFPVFNICDGVGLATGDPRGLTLTGGLPYFGGPGNNYVMHALCALVARLRAEPGTLGLVGANGGLLSSHAVGVYSSTPRAFEACDSRPAQRAVDALPAVPLTPHPEGWGTVETCTVLHDRSGPQTVVVVGRCARSGGRFLAHSAPGDAATLAAFSDARAADGLQRRILARRHEGRNLFALSESALAAIAPSTSSGSGQ